MLTELLCILTGLALIGIVYLIISGCEENFEGGPSKVCVFDIDNTLTANRTQTTNRLKSESGFPASSYAKKAVEYCRKKGYGVSVATAETEKVAKSAKQTKFLKSVGIDPKTDPIEACPNSKSKKMYDPNSKKSYDSCTDTRYGVVSMSHGEDARLRLVKDPPSGGSVKKPMYENIAKHFGVGLNKLVIFDDDGANLRLCRYMTGNCNNCIQASKNCGGKWCPDGNGITKSDFRDFPDGV